MKRKSVRNISYFLLLALLTFIIFTQNAVAIDKNESNATTAAATDTNTLEKLSLLDTLVARTNAIIKSIFGTGAKITQTSETIETIEILDSKSTPVISDFKTYDETKQQKKTGKTSSLSVADLPNKGELEVNAIASKNVAVKLKINMASKGEVILDDFGKNNPVSVPLPGRVVKFVEIGAKNISFSSADITIRYSEAELNGGSENDLTIYHWNGASWDAVPTVIDTLNKTLRATTTSLSHWGVATSVVIVANSTGNTGESGQLTGENSYANSVTDAQWTTRTAISAANMNALSADDTTYFAQAGSSTKDAIMNVNFTLSGVQSVNWVKIRVIGASTTNAEAQQIGLYNSTWGNWTKVNGSTPATGVYTEWSYNVSSASNKSNYLTINASNYLNFRVAYWINGASNSGISGDLFEATVNYVQLAEISGYVNNASSGLPLSSATVQINRSLPSTTTSATGAYNFTGLPNGTYMINASLAGYVTNTINVTISGADNTTANISLSPLGKPNIIDWSNNKTNDQGMSININTSEFIKFNATANQTITSWNWSLDDVTQINNYDNFTTNFSSGTHTVKVNASNSIYTSDTITWTVSVGATASTWPTEEQWNPILNQTYQNITDPISDAAGGAGQGKVEIVGNDTYTAAYMYNDGKNLFFRMRLGEDPRAGKTYLASGRWVILMDTDGNLDDYEYGIVAESASFIDYVRIVNNSIKLGLGRPNDVWETEFISYTNQVNTSSAPSYLSGSQDYFINWFVPLNDFFSYTNTTNQTVLRLILGTGSGTANKIDKDLGGTGLPPDDLTLYLNNTVTAPVSLKGIMLSNGSIAFVDSNYTTSVSYININDTIYVKVNDSDRNYDILSNQTLKISLNTSTGDRIANFTLTETNKNTGIFTGNITTQNSSVFGINTSDNILQVNWSATINATYNDTTTSGTYINRTATLSVLGPPDTTAPASITNLTNITYARTYINWTWTNPADSDFSKVMVYLNGTFQINVTWPTNYYNATGLTANTSYTLSTHTVDTSGNINQTWVNSTSITAPVPDTTPPASITNLTNITYAQTYINWTWTNPVDPDFAKVMVYLNGTFQINVTWPTNYYNATGLTANTSYTLSTHTVDTSGNINQTWVNHTAWTVSPVTMYSLNITYQFIETNSSSTWQSISINDNSYADPLANVSIFNATSGSWESILTTPFAGDTNLTEHVNVSIGASGNASNYDAGGGLIKIRYNWTNSTSNSSLGVNMINVTVLYLNSTFLLNLTTNTTSIPVDTNYYLEINYSCDANDAYSVYVFNGTSWNLKGNLTSTAWDQANFTHDSSSEIINGNVSVRYIDQTPAGINRGNLSIDYQRIHGFTYGSGIYSLNVTSNTTDVPNASMNTLQIGYNVSAGGDNFILQIWNGSFWNNRATLNDTSYSYRNIALESDELIKTGVIGPEGPDYRLDVLVRYVDMNINTTQQGKLYLDYQRVYSS